MTPLPLQITQNQRTEHAVRRQQRRRRSLPLRIHSSDFFAVTATLVDHLGQCQNTGCGTEMGDAKWEGNYTISNNGASENTQRAATLRRWGTTRMTVLLVFVCLHVPWQHGGACVDRGKTHAGLCICLSVYRWVGECVCVCVWPHLVGIDPVAVFGCQVGFNSLQR